MRFAPCKTFDNMKLCSSGRQKKVFPISLLDWAFGLSPMHGPTKITITIEGSLRFRNSLLALYVLFMEFWALFGINKWLWDVGVTYLDPALIHQDPTVGVARVAKGQKCLIYAILTEPPIAILVDRPVSVRFWYNFDLSRSRHLEPPWLLMAIDILWHFCAISDPPKATDSNFRGSNGNLHTTSDVHCF